MELHRVTDKLCFQFHPCCQRHCIVSWRVTVSVGAQVVASSLDTLEPVLLEGFDSKEDLVACLKASANVPRIAGDPIQLRYTPLSPSMTLSPVIGPPF